MRLVDSIADPAVPLAPLTTYKMGGPADHLARPASMEEVADLAAFVADHPDLPVLVLGRGSNLVVADAGFPGLVIQLGPLFLEVVLEEDGTVRAGGAAPLPITARTAARAGRGGLEFFVGIPGSVGGAVRMNAGCHGSETTEWLSAARVVDLRTGEASDRTPGDLELAYRHSNLRPDELVVEARFRTVASSPEESLRVIREITRWRRDTQPGGTFNAGSVFRNPDGDAAGAIIDRLGLQGFRVGQAAVSTKHANFFVAEPGAPAQDVYDLVWAVRRRVGEETGIWLTPEVQFAGRFRESADREAGP